LFDDIVVDVCHVSMPLLRLTVTQRLDLVETCDDRIFGKYFLSRVSGRALISENRSQKDNTDIDMY